MTPWLMFKFLSACGAGLAVALFIIGLVYRTVWEPPRRPREAPHD